MGGGTVAFAFEGVKRARALCPGSVGEVLQGVIGGREVLVSLTVDRFSEMEVILDAGVSSTPPGLWKSKKALELALEYFRGGHLRERVTLRRRKSLPEGKGFASSTADIAATVGAVAHLLGRKIREEEIARLALSIEPTDGTFFPSWCLFDHLRGEVFLALAVPRHLGVVVVELPGEVPTLLVDREKLRRHFERFSRETEKAFELLERGLEEGDLALVGKAATLSSAIMQEYERSEIFFLLSQALQDIRALGVNRAHTGNAFGVLFDLRLVSLEEARRRVSEVLRGKDVTLWTARAIGGGIRVVGT